MVILRSEATSCDYPCINAANDISHTLRLRTIWRQLLDIPVGGRVMDLGCRNGSLFNCRSRYMGFCGLSMKEGLRLLHLSTKCLI
jgi:hypothetical protein